MRETRDVPQYSAYQVRHIPDSGRFTASVEGHECVALYRIYGKVMMLTHTGVPKALRGRGIAAVLVQAALDHARERGLKVRPDCSYAEDYMHKHPATLDLLAE
jgi:predicted GNAT family acetyltransferase